MKRAPLSPRTVPRRANRRGSALVIGLLILIVLSVAAAGTSGMLSSERRAVSDLEAGVDAYDLARSAHDRFVANPIAALPGFTPPTWTGPDSALISLPRGSAWVSLQRIRPAVGGSSALYLVRARAVRTAFQNANSPGAERVFAQYARWQSGSMSPLSAWTSLTGITKNGGSGTVSGVDACGAASPVGGVAVPAVPGYTQNGGSSVPNGSPNILNMGSQAAANALVPVDWAGIVAGTSITPDLTIPGGAWPSFASPSFWPIIYVNQAANWSLPGDGRGILIVRNDLTISGSRSWDGIVLVGGAVTSNGNNTVEGSLVTGLNVLLGQSAGVSDMGNGTKTFRFNSCKVATAAARFGGLAPLRNASVDNWPTY